MVKWIALFSQTGSELADIIDTLGITPDSIFTTNSSLNKDPRIQDMSMYKTHDQIMEIISKNTDQFITLHGYLRIIPKDICDSNEIYNGHPGDVVEYPQLIGINPQQKALHLQLPTTGVIIHKVTEDIDQGTIMYREQYMIRSYDNLNSLCSELKQLSVKNWVKLIKEKYANRDNR